VLETVIEPDSPAFLTLTVPTAVLPLCVKILEGEILQDGFVVGIKMPIHSAFTNNLKTGNCVGFVLIKTVTPLVDAATGPLSPLNSELGFEFK